MIQFELIGGLLFIPVEVEHTGRKVDLKFIIDSGSAGSSVDINLVKPDFHRKSRLAEIVGVGGSQPAVIQEIDAIRINDTLLRQFPLELADLENPFGIEGIIGNDLLDKCSAIIDYSARHLILRTA